MSTCSLSGLQVAVGPTVAVRPQPPVERLPTSHVAGEAVNPVRCEVDDMTVGESRVIQYKERAAAAGVTEIVTGDVAAETADLRAENEQLREAMDSRATIEQARGMLMVLASCSGRAAWPMLVEISQHSNVKLRDVAAALVAAATGGLLPPEIEPAYRQALARARRAHTR